MPLSLLSSKLLELQLVAHYLLQAQAVMVHCVMVFLGKTKFCTNKCVQLCHLCCVILQLPYLVQFNFTFQCWINFRDCLSCSRFRFPFKFLFFMWLLLQMLIQSLGLLFSGSCVTFIFLWNLVRFYV